MKKLDIRWMNPHEIPHPPKRMSRMDLVCADPRKHDIEFVEGLRLTYKPQKSAAHGWLWVSQEEVEKHTDNDKHCLLVCGKGSGVLHYGNNDYPMCAGTYTIFDSTIPHGYTKIHASTFLCMPIKEKKFAW